MIPQIDRPFSLTREMLLDYRVRSASAELVPLANLVDLRSAVEGVAG